MKLEMVAVIDPGKALPLIFRPNIGPKGRKKFFRDHPPPLSQGLNDELPPYMNRELKHEDFLRRRRRQ